MAPMNRAVLELKRLYQACVDNPNDKELLQRYETLLLAEIKLFLQPDRKTDELKAFAEFIAEATAEYYRGEAE